MFFKVNTFFAKLYTFFAKGKKYFLIALFYIPLFTSAQTNNEVKKTDVFYGKASFYDEYFNGRKTANGELFSHKLLTAAHPSWPFNTKVKVTNIANSKSVVVRINDRGPFIRGRNIDVSKQAAIELDFVKSGVVKVKMEILNWGTKPNTYHNEPLLAVAKVSTEKNQKNSIKASTTISATTLSSDSIKTITQNNPPIVKSKVEPKSNKQTEKTGIKDAPIKKSKPILASNKSTIYCSQADSLSGWCVQVGCYGSRANADKAVKAVKEITREWTCIQEISRNEVAYYRVVCGKNIENSKAVEIKKGLAEKYPDAFITNYVTLLNSSAKTK